ncbi:RND family efflux transporter MFP subunit [Rhodopirellula maiorica SM1]|uniref:RND family efflux transporter MFP subunit n=2 Tax=Novipirellula TaxID=2795426 RepID=M5RKL3_9BACT|nr:RND family efflux transporter MFP subunit [Rhodopirellula maiorica SM1]
MLLIAIAFCGCSGKNESKIEAKPKSLETLDVDVLAIELSPWPRTVRSQGSVYADEQSVVGAKVAGRVAEVHGDVGDVLKLGDPLVTLDQEDFLLQVEQAEAQLLQARSSVGLLEGDPVDKLDPANAPPVRQERALWEETQSSLERISSLRSQNAMSQGEYDVAAAAERVAEARYASAVNGVREKIALIQVRQVELAVARERLKDAIIRAPMDGFVLNRLVAPGTFVAVGQPVATIVRTNPLRFRGKIPERHSQSIAVGQRLTLNIESVTEPREATITRVSPALDQQSRALTFEALIENENQVLRAGLFAEAEVVTDPDAYALVVPESAISEFAGATKAWIVVDGVTREQEVRIGGRREGAFEVVQGLSPGDLILRNAEQGRVGKVNSQNVPQASVQSSAPIAAK